MGIDSYSSYLDLGVMPGISRKAYQLSTWHICAGVTILDTPTQSTVRANNILIARKTDKTVSHPFPPAPLCPPHVAMVNKGSSTVRVVGLPVARIDDSADNGQLIKGSLTVRAG